jgi:RNA polymerase sigma factor (sigma-70 family)
MAGWRAPREFAHVLEAARAGKGWAFTQLFGLVADPLVRYLRAQGAEDADGLANEVLLKAFIQIARFEGDESGFRAWVFSIARFRLIDARRATSRRPQCVGGVDMTGAVGGDTELEAISDLGRAWVDEVLEKLVPEQRDVMTLRFVSDLTINETAEVLGKSRGAVKALQHRALGALRRQLQLSEEDFAALAASH